MKASYVQKGDSIDYTPDADVNAGDVIVLGTNMLGIAKLDIKAEELGALALVGVFDMPKSTGSGTAIERGVNTYWDASSQVVVTDSNSGANIHVGRTIAASSDEDATVRVRLRQ
jgi:predicted RecA/RadA family phage recombinase